MSHVAVFNRQVFNKAIMASFVILGWEMATEDHFTTQAVCVHSGPLLDSQSKEGDRHGALFPPYVYVFFSSLLSGFPIYDFFPWFQSWKETHLKCKYMYADGKPSLHIVKSQRKAARNLMELGNTPSTKY